MLARRVNSPTLGLFEDMLDGLESWDQFFSLGGLREAEDPVRVTSGNDSNGYFVRAVVPGFTQDQLNVSVNGNKLTVSGKQETKVEEKNYHSSSRSEFSRTIVLPSDAFTDNVNAVHENGILLVTVPRKNGPTLETKTVPIKVLETKKQ